MTKTSDILIIRFSSLGDIVLTTSFVKHIRSRFQESDIYFLTKKRFKELLDFFPVKVVPVFLEDFSSLYELGSFLKQHGFLRIYDLHRNLRSNILKLQVSGHFHQYKKYHFYRLYKTYRHQKKLDLRTIDSYFTALGEETIPERKPDPEMKSSITRNARAEGKHKIGIHIGASRITKQWPLEYVIELIRSLKEKKEYSVTVIGGKSESEGLIKIKEEIGESIRVSGPELTLTELIETIQEQDLMLTNDSGPAHIAASSGIPLLAVFGATHPSLGFAPEGKDTKIITSDKICSPCTLHGDISCPKKHFRCMLSIKPDLIIEEINRFFSSGFSLEM